MIICNNKTVTIGCSSLKSFDHAVGFFMHSVYMSHVCRDECKARLHPTPSDQYSTRGFVRLFYPKIIIYNKEERELKSKTELYSHNPYLGYILSIYARKTHRTLNLMMHHRVVVREWSIIRAIQIV